MRSLHTPFDKVGYREKTILPAASNKYSRISDRIRETALRPMPPWHIVCQHSRCLGRKSELNPKLETLDRVSQKLGVRYDYVIVMTIAKEQLNHSVE